MRTSNGSAMMRVLDVEVAMYETMFIGLVMEYDVLL